MARKKKRSIYDKYREILDKPKLTDEDIDKSIGRPPRVQLLKK